MVSIVMGIRILSSGKRPFPFLTAVFFIFLFTACQGTTDVVYPTPILPASVPLPAATPTGELAASQPDRPPTPMITPQTAVTLPPLPQPAEPAPAVAADQGWRIGAGPDTPGALQAQIAQFAAASNGRFTWVGEAEADVRLGLEGERPFAQWSYVVAAPFPTIADEISLGALQAAWRGEGETLFVAPDTAALFTALWGAGAAQIVPAEALVEQLWAARPALALTPFEQLQPELKALRLDGASAVAHDFNPAAYPLTVAIGLDGAETAVADFLAAYPAATARNYRPDQLTRIAITGVTALVRATAYNMEQRGILWPAEDVGPVLQTADIAHISNEVAFTPDCPYPNPIGGTTFCSRDSYFALLEHLEVDVIDLTGNHLNDYGRENLVRTIGMYEAAGMATFGGGRDAAHAAEPALFEHHGNRIAFVGCNSFGPNFAWATADGAGARPCDESIMAQIGELAAAGYLVIATTQEAEYYQYAPTPQQVAISKAMVEAGASIVSGSQAHHAMGFGFHDGGFIHYGPGNLFFDQMNMLGTRQAFVATYLVENGRLLHVDLWTGLIENYAKPRLMTPQERAEALTAVFQASGW